jgi:hypothetical protein
MLAIRTREGLGIGDTYDRLHATYPALVPVGSGRSHVDGRGRVAIPDNPGAHYRIYVSNATVTQLSLDANQQRCFE